MFFTKNEIMPVRLVKAVSERTILCCYSLHSSADIIIDFYSSLQFESITPFVCPDKDTSFDSVEAFYFKYAQTSEPKHVNRCACKVVEREN